MTGKKRVREREGREPFNLPWRPVHYKHLNAFESTLTRGWSNEEWKHNISLPFYPGNGAFPVPSRARRHFRGDNLSVSRASNPCRGRNPHRKLQRQQPRPEGLGLCCRRGSRAQVLLRMLKQAASAPGLLSEQFFRNYQLSLPMAKEQCGKYK